MAYLGSAKATLMTDPSLFYESDVTTRSGYGSAPGLLLLRLRSGTTMTPRTTRLDVNVSRHEEEIDRQRAAWMVAAQVGDRVAYEKLLHDCIPFIKRVARGQGVRFEFIDDVVQEALLTVHQARHTYDPNRSFTAWLRTIAQWRAIDGLRRAARTRTREVHAPLAYVSHSDSSGHPEETVPQNDHAKLLNFALGKLSVRQREAVEHLALQSRSLAQTATVTGRSTGSLRLDWHRALKTLRAQFGEKDRDRDPIRFE
jgi:RNA polymerase sigma factor (sigma-70 family)